MTPRLWIIAICSIVIYNIYYEKNLFTKLKGYKKYYKIGIVMIMGVGALSIMKKSPKMSYENLSTINSFIKTMPIDKTSKDMITPFLETNASSVGKKYEMSASKIMNSGSKSNKRSVSETKKKFVASQQNWKCNKCEQKLNHTFEVDHVLRLENGGTNEVTNLEALCRECHGQKTAFENF
jgi:rubredoxin